MPNTRIVSRVTQRSCRMNAMYKTIRLEISESIATLTVDRPDVKNALNLETVQECRAALVALAADATVGVLIITGAGEIGVRLGRRYQRHPGARP